MLPGNILPDPRDPEENYLIMRAPPSMDNCSDLQCRFTGHPADGTAGFMAEWLPTDEEKALIMAGAPIRTFICAIEGRNGQLSLPPQSVWVREPDEI